MTTIISRKPETERRSCRVELEEELRAWTAFEKRMGKFYPSIVRVYLVITMLT